MKTLFLVGAIICSLHLHAQFNDYTAIGYSPRFILTTGLGGVYSSYESNFDTVITPLEPFKKMHGISILAGYQPDNLVNNIALNIWFAKSYGEELHSGNILATQEFKFTDLSIKYDLGYNIIDGDGIIVMPCLGIDLSAEFISAEINNSYQYGGFSGGMSGIFNGGVYGAVQVMGDLGDYTIIVKPVYSWYYKKWQFDDFHYELTNDEFYTGEKKNMTTFGCEILVGLWR